MPESNSINQSERSDISKEDDLIDKVQQAVEEKRKEKKSYYEETKEYLLDEENSKKIQKFISTALVSSVVIIIFGLYGSMMSYLVLALQESKGLGGVNMNGPPFRPSNVFNPCNVSKKQNDFSTMLQTSLIEYGFPYRNPISCDKFNAIKEPFLYIRFTRWLTEMIAYSYSNGRQLLNMYFGFFDSKTAFWVMPFTNLIILLLAPLYGLFSHGIGGFITAPELLPRLPLGSFAMNPFSMTLTFIAYIIAIFTLPPIFTIVQVLLLVFLLFLYPIFQKESFSFPSDDNNYLNGFSFITKYFQTKTPYLLTIWLISVIINAYSNLEPLMALFISGIIILHFLITKYKTISSGISYAFSSFFNTNNGIVIVLFFITLIMGLLTLL